MSKKTTTLFGEEKVSIPIRQQIAKYLSYWPLFLISVIVCVSGGLLYIRYASPKYMATTAFLVKGGEGPQSSEDLIDAAMGGKRDINISNEIMLISSSTLMERTVRKHGFNVFYFKKESIGNVDVYKDAPFEVTKKDPSDESFLKLQIEEINPSGGKYSTTVKAAPKLPFQWNVPVTVNGQTIVISPKAIIGANQSIYTVECSSVRETAAKLASAFAVRPLDNKLSVIQLSIKTENLQRGKDILNAIFKEFNQSNIENRNELSDSTVSFINDRLVVVTDELKNVEGNLENLQQSRQLVDVKAQAAQSLENSSDITKAIKNINTQQGVTNMISQYIADPANGNRIVPSSIGLDDPNLTSLLNRYNEVILKKEKETPNVAPKSTVMQDLNTQAADLKTSILENLNTVNRNLRLQENNLAQQNRQYTGFLSALPRNERAMQEIKRKQGITEGLYLYLLQKREEAAISRTSANIPHYTQVDPASGYGPVDPNKKNIIIVAIFLGILLPLAWIYLKGLLNDKVNSVFDVRQQTNIPLVGTISSIPKSQKEPIVVFGNDVVGEQFRALRTNLSSLVSNHYTKKILITSIGRNEGKSFVSLNLAAVCALAGKKVALLEFDLRRPSIHRNLNIENDGGIAPYLKGEVSYPAFHTFANILSLHFYNAGSSEFNAGDLLLNNKLQNFFDYLQKEKYDYVIIDSASAGLVSDATVLSEHADIALFVVRAAVSSKTQVDLINGYTREGNYANPVILLNCIKAPKKPGQYTG